MDFSIHGVREAAADGEAQARAAVLACGRLVGLCEGVENPIELVRRYTDAGVVHFNPNSCPPGRGGLCEHAHADAAGFGEFQSIIDQIGHDLIEPRRVADDDARRFRRHIGRQRQALGSRAFPEQASDVLDELVDREGRFLQFELAGLDLRQVEDVADNAALSAAREMAIIRDNPTAVEQVALNYVQSGLDGDTEIVAAASVDQTDLAVEVRLEAPARTFLSGIVGGDRDAMTVDATARLSGEAGNVCLIALSGVLHRAISMEHNSLLSASNCAIYSNSDARQSMYVSHRADIEAENVFLAGGFVGRSTEIFKKPMTDSPPIGDPLEGRPAPAAASGNCDYNDKVVHLMSELKPGVYCGGLVVDGAKGELSSGVYVLRDGPLTVMNGGELCGENVGFYFQGADAKLDIRAESTVELTAPKTGDLTGLIFFADPSNGTVSNGKNNIRAGHLIRATMLAGSSARFICRTTNS